MTTSPLALLGGTPAVTHDGPHFTWPPMTAGTVAAVTAQMSQSISVYDRSGIIADLEDALRDYHGCRRAVLTSSGTAALHSMYAACGLGPGDEVIVPAYTFFATVTPLLHVGATPVLAECDATGNLDPGDVERRITARTRAIVVTHMWGLPADMTLLSEVAEAHGLMLLEDGSHAHGASIDGRKAGTFGCAAAFSMNGPKPLSAGEGGFVLTDDEEIYHRVLLHGQYNKRCRNEIPTNHPLYPYAVTGMGLKLRIHPLAAAIAREQLPHLDAYLEGRAHVAEVLCRELGSLPGLVAPVLPDGVRASWYGLPLLYQPEELDGLGIERFHEALLAEGCREADRPGSTCPLNLLPLFQKPKPPLPNYPGNLSYVPGNFPMAEAIWRNTLKLPVWHTEAQMALVHLYIQAITKVITNHDDLLG